MTAALVAGGVSLTGLLLGRLWLDRRLHRQELQSDYEYEQKKALRGLVGNYQGRLLDRATGWHYRMASIYANVEKGWLDVHNELPVARYFLVSTLYRFLALMAQASRFENEQVYIDARVAEPRDVDFVKFVKLVHWVMSDPILFRGLEYERDAGVDHFASDRLRSLCEAFAGDGDPPSFRVFERDRMPRIERSYADSLRGRDDDAELTQVFAFFDGLSPAEDRFRWDRLVCLHLVTIAFISAFGYAWQRPPQLDLRHAVAQIGHPEIARNLSDWFPSFGLVDQSSVPDLRELLDRRAQEPSSGTGRLQTV